MVSGDWRAKEVNLQDRIIFGIAQVCLDEILGSVGGVLRTGPCLL